MTDSDPPSTARDAAPPHVLVWPEGRPDEAVSPTNGWRTALVLVRLHLRNLINPSKARRTRVASCAEGRPDAHLVEAALEDAGAIPPPGGWPRPRRTGRQDADAPRGDVLISTRSVI